MGSLIDELQCREAAAREEAGELRGRIEQLTERLARVEERLVITRETVEQVLNEGAGTEAEPIDHVRPARRAGRRHRAAGTRSALRRSRLATGRLLGGSAGAEFCGGLARSPGG
jgi:hypothetical protein